MESGDVLAHRYAAGFDAYPTCSNRIYLGARIIESFDILRSNPARGQHATTPSHLAQLSQTNEMSTISANFDIRYSCAAGAGDEDKIKSLAGDGGYNACVETHGKRDARDTRGFALLDVL